MAAITLLLIHLFWSIVPPGIPAAQADDPVVVEILSPVQGEALQGNIPIIGTIRTTGYQGGMLAFSYDEDERSSWFEINRISLPQEEAELGVWDTTTLTDGNYTLRLEVLLISGEVITHTVTDLRVRNYTTIETNTPAPTDTPAPDQQPTRIPPTTTPTRSPPSPTPLPPNPGELTLAQLSTSVERGILITIAAFAVLGFLVLRRRFR